MSDSGVPSAMAARDGSCTAFFGEAETVFRLDIGAIRRLEEKRGCGIFALQRRMVDQSAWIDDVVEVLRQGLIGAGMPPAEAARLVTAYGPGSGLGSAIDAYALAVLVLHAGLLTPSGERPPGKAAAGEAPPASTSPVSTAAAGRSA